MFEIQTKSFCSAPMNTETYLDLYKMLKTAGLEPELYNATKGYEMINFTDYEARDWWLYNGDLLVVDPVRGYVSIPSSIFENLLNEVNDGEATL